MLRLTFFFALFTYTVPAFVACSSLLTLPAIANALEDDEETESGDGQGAPTKPVGASDEGLQAIGSFKKPEGWKITLFAAEPELANPVALCLDYQGRVYVCESFRQDRGVTDNRKHDNEWLLADLSAQSVQDRIDYHLRLLGDEAAVYTAHDDRIRLLEDTDSDGVADKATMFAEGFNKLEEGTGAGVLVRGNDVFYTCIPKLWKLTDEDGDGVSDQRIALQDGYGVRVAFRGHDSHGLIMGHDGRLYFSIGDRGYNIETPDGKLKNVESGAVFRCELDGSNLEVFATGLRNPQELAFDDYGYLFTGDNNSDSGDKARWVNVMQGGDTGWRMMYQYLPDRGPFNREKIWYPYDPATTPAYTVPPIANIGDGPSGLACYPGTGLTGDYQNCFFMVDFRGGAANSGIRLIRSEEDGAFWKIERSEQPIWNILATDAEFGPDGRLYVCDWVNGWVGEGKGRVYRFEDEEAQTQSIVREVQAMLSAGFKDVSTERLVELMGHADRRIRLESQWELALRGNFEALAKTAKNADLSTLHRLHGLWGIMHATRKFPQLRVQTGKLLAKNLQDKDRDVRRVALLAVGDLKLTELGEEVTKAIKDGDPRVRYAAAMAAYKLQLKSALPSVAEMLAENADQDPALRHAGIMALVGQVDEDRVAGLAKHESKSVRLAAVVALRKLKSQKITAFLQDMDQQVALEASRAIHDVVELHEALPILAEYEGSALANDAVAHRVLNANFRLGGPEAASRIANFAADSQRSEKMRIEAIEMLGSWGKPGELDRVMNRFLPIADRDNAPALKVVEENFAALFVGSDDLAEAAIETASSLGIPSAAERLISLAKKQTNSPSLRAAAVVGYAKLEQKNAVDDLFGLLEDKESFVRAAALQQLGSLAPGKALPALRKALQAGSEYEKQMGWDTLAKIKRPASKKLAEKALTEYLSGKLNPAVWLNFKQAAAKLLGKDAKEKMSAYEEKLAESDPLELYRDALQGGDVKRGSEIFFTKTELSCVRCHQVGSQGGEVGPVLTEIGKAKDRRYLLEAIAYPDAKIAENFETIILLTEDDEVLTGILKKETDTEIQLIDADGKILTVDPDIILARRKGKSSMPADLLKSMSRSELRDLVAYLASLKGE